MSKTLSEHLDPKTGKKRILSLDGGGIRGALTLGYLKKLETELCKDHGPDYVLSDHFDLIGGTSTGAIIATALSLGWKVDKIKEMYFDLGGKIFGDKNNWWNPLETAKALKANFDYKVLEGCLKAAFGDLTLGSPEVKTGLCIVAKRADTNSVWPLLNHPGGKFFNTPGLGENAKIPLWRAVRASTAAPTYFLPQMLEVDKGQIGAFVDGGVSMANNPSLTLLKVATLKGFPFHWEMGEDKLSLLSIGSGSSVLTKKVGEIEDSWLLSWASLVPDMLMQDASWQNRLVLQWISNSPTREELDGEVGDMEGDLLGGIPLIKYLRYNFFITEKNLNDLNLGKKFGPKDVASLVEMSNGQNRFLLYEIGKVAAETQILNSHLNYLE